MRRAVTILDVAKRAGVSTATVSRTLTDPARVAESTRDRVIAAIAETGFTPNASARNLRSRSTKIVLSLVPGLNNTFFTPILNAIEDTLSEAGYGMIIGDTRHSPVKERLYAQLIRAGQVDGIILFTGQLPHEAEAVIRAGRPPVALVCNEIPGEADFPVFDVTNRRSACLAVEHLIEAGHRRIALIAGAPDNIEAEQRRMGYRDAIEAAGMTVDDGLIWGDNFRLDAGIEAGRRFLAATDRPTAVFASADEAAIGFIKTLRETAIRVPEDVSVIGFDDLDNTDLIDPPLTTMHQPRADLGHAAASDLLLRMQDETSALPPTRLRLPCRLVVRKSVRRLDAPTSTATPSGTRREPDTADVSR